MKKNILIVGGTSGVGFALAEHYVSEGHNVGITGRKNSVPEGATFFPLDISHHTERLARELDKIVEHFPGVNTLIYAAGFLQRAHIDQIDDENLGRMVNVGLLGPMLLIQRLKRASKYPLKIMLVTSSSQYTPREWEPAYCAVNSGLGMLGASLVLDHEIGKVLVVAPSGIQTPFWDGSGEDTTTMLDPDWVASTIVDLSSGPFKYKYAKILRSPKRVDVIETWANVHG